MKKQFPLYLLFFSLLVVALVACQENTSEGDGPSLPSPDPGNSGIQLPDNFGAIAVIDSIGNGRGRHLVVNENGDIYIHLRRLTDSSSVVALRDTTGNGKADFMEAFGNVPGTGIDIHDGYLYYSTRKHVHRRKMVAGQLLPDSQVDTVITFPDSTTRGHGSKAFTFDGQGNIYVNIGSKSNACQEEARSPGSKGKDPCPELPYRAAIWNRPWHDSS